MSGPDAFYLEWKRSGGQVPTLRPQIKVTAQDLSPDERAQLDGLLQSADLFNLPERYPAKRLPDSFEHQLTVCDSAGRKRTLVFKDQDGHPPAIDAIVNWMRTRGR